MKTTYQARAKPWAYGWELHIDGVGVTQSETLDDAELMARDYIASRLDVDPDSFDVTITPEKDRLDAIVAALCAGNPAYRPLSEQAKAQIRRWVAEAPDMTEGQRQRVARLLRGSAYFTRS